MYNYTLCTFREILFNFSTDCDAKNSFMSVLNNLLDEFSKKRIIFVLRNKIFHSFSLKIPKFWLEQNSHNFNKHVSQDIDDFFIHLIGFERLTEKG